MSSIIPKTIHNSSLRHESSVQSLSSLGSYDKLSPSDHERTEILGFNCHDANALERAIFASVNTGDRERLATIFHIYPSSTTILQILLTTSYPNRDGFYKHDDDILQDAHELLGESLEHLNVMHIACLLGEEEIALDILEFVNRITEEIEARKILYEFLGRIWGNGNTVLHLASFCGMSDLVKRLLELGAAHVKPNDRKYRPVDCADDDTTRKMFENVHELIKKHPDINSACGKDKFDTGSIIPSIGTMEALRKKPTAEQKLSHRREDSFSNTNSNESMASNSTAPEKRLVSNKGMTGPSIGSTSSLTSRKKPKQKVRFDRPTILMDLCSNKEESESDVNLFRETLGLNSSSQPLVDVNQIFSPQQHMTLLQLACSHGKLQIAMILLLEAGANVNDRDREGWTALHCASAEGNTEILRLLARCHGHKNKEVIPLTLNPDNQIIYVPDGPIILNPQNDDGETPEEVALDEKATEIQALFKDLKIRYPESFNEIIDHIDEASSTSEVDEEEELDLIIQPRLSDSKNRISTILSRAPSIMKSASRERHTK